MKKLTKILALILVCGAFALAGCGGLSLDVSGDYKDSTEKEYEAYAENATFNAIGYEFEASSKSTGASAQDLKTKGKVLFDEEGKITGLYYEESGSETVDGKKVSVNVKYYIKDGKFYTEEKVDGETTKTYRDQTDSDAYYEIIQYIPNSNTYRMVSSSFAKAVKYTKAVKNDYTKFKFEPNTYNDGYSGKCNVWLVFDKDAKAYGSKVEMDIKSDGMTAKGNIVSKQFNGKISYPSFDDFKAEA